MQIAFDLYDFILNKTTKDKKTVRNMFIDVADIDITRKVFKDKYEIESNIFKNLVYSGLEFGLSKFGGNGIGASAALGGTTGVDTGAKMYLDYKRKRIQI